MGGRVLLLETKMENRLLHVPYIFATWNICRNPLFYNAKRKANSLEIYREYT